MNNATNTPAEKPLTSLKEMGYRFAWCAHMYPHQVDVFEHEETGKRITATRCGTRMVRGSSAMAVVKFGAHYYCNVQETDLKPPMAR